MKLAIVVGHEKVAPGAVGSFPSGPRSEYFWNTELAQMIAARAKELGLETFIFFRDEVGITGAYQLVNKWAGEDLACAMELHFNAYNEKATGTETLFDRDPPDSEELARGIQAAMLQALPRPWGSGDRGIQGLVPGDRGYGNLKACKIASVITEPFFGDCARDAQIAEQKKPELARALAEAAHTFLVARQSKQPDPAPASEGLPLAIRTRLADLQRDLESITDDIRGLLGGKV